MSKDQPKTRKNKRALRLVSSKDLAHGQIVIVAARWILVLAGLLFAMWNPGPLGELRVQILVILMLAVVNFYLQAQLLMRKPAIDLVVYAASAGDLAVITILVIALGGFKTNTYIYYFPAILAFSVAFPTFLTVLYIGGTMSLYALISLATPGHELQIVIARLLMLLAIAVCGNMFRRIEQNRRQAATQAQEDLMVQIRERQAAPPAAA